MAFVAALWAVSAQAEKTLNIYWVDVEGGAATLIVTPAGQSILIDSGNPGTRDAGRIHEVATKIAGLKKIDFLITTHFHRDHFGGAAPLSQLMPIGTVYDNGIPARNPDRNRQDPAFLLKVKPYKEMKVDARVVVDLVNIHGADAVHGMDEFGFHVPREVAAIEKAEAAELNE